MGSASARVFPGADSWRFLDLFHATKQQPTTDDRILKRTTPVPSADDDPATATATASSRAVFDFLR